jgi:hypothetical protein
VEEIGEIVDLETFEMLAKSLMHAHDSNEALNCWLFEELFFLRLRKGVLVLTNLGSIKQSTYDPESLPILDVNQTIGLRPVHYNKVGYDAVFVDIPNKVIQVFHLIASSMKQCLDIGKYKILMDNFYRSNIHFQNIKFELQIIYVVDLKRLDDLVINSVTGQGSLGGYVV